jgi:uncharacterized protein (DUF433 family)
MATVGSSHIEIDDQGVARIAGTTTKVVEVALDYLAYGWSPDEMHNQHPYLSLAQIHAAMAYYYDHQVELDARIRKDLEELDQMASDAQDSPLREKLLQLKKSRL